MTEGIRIVRHTVDYPAMRRFSEEVKSRGVRIDGEPENKPWGHRAFTVRDPDGLLITFYQDLNRHQTENV